MFLVYGRYDTTEITTTNLPHQHKMPHDNTIPNMFSYKQSIRWNIHHRPALLWCFFVILEPDTKLLTYLDRIGVASVSNGTALVWDFTFTSIHTNVSNEASLHGNMMTNHKEWTVTSITAW